MNQASSNGNTPLLWAVKMGFLLCTKALLGTPTIDVNASNREGKTALILAAEKGRVAILKQLLSAPGVDIGLVTLDGNTVRGCEGKQSDGRVAADPRKPGERGGADQLHGEHPGQTQSGGGEAPASLSGLRKGYGQFSS